MIDKTPKIVCADHFYMTPKAIGVLKKVGEVVWSEAESEDEFIQEVAEARVIISEYVRITSQILDAAKKLRGVVVWGVGYDHVDVDAASKRGIYVVNTRGSNAESVAEQTFAFILALSRRLLKATRFVSSGRWTSLEEASLPSCLIGNDLYGKILGIIGLGNIGRRVARIAKGFNMQILVYDPYLPKGIAQKIGVKLCSLHDVVSKADYVTIHTVLSNETQGLLGAKEIALMKPTAYLINTSRGPVVDQKALVKALAKESIAGAALDVYESEPLDKMHPLAKIVNVILTPHYAGNSKEALETTSMRVSEEVSRLVKGELPLNVVNRRQLQKLGFISED